MAGVLHRYGPLPHQLAFISPTATATATAPPPPKAEPRGADARPPAKAAAAVHVVLVSGLTEGLLALPYAPALVGALSAASERLDGLRLSLVQVQLRSSYDGWGRASLDGDADEVFLLMRWLRRARGSRGVVLVGHSTGCQIACRVCERFEAALHMAAKEALDAEDEEEEEEEEARRRMDRGGGGGGGGGVAAAPPRSDDPSDADPDLPPPLLGVCLQAPVSDREYFFAAQPQQAAAWLAAARAAIAAGDPERVVAVVEGSPLSARRAAALLERLGDDDMFSRDLTVEEMRAATSVAFVAGLGRVHRNNAAPPPALGRRPVLVLASGADEYALPLPPEAPTGEWEAAKHAAVHEAVARVASAASAAPAGPSGPEPAAAAVTVAGAPHNGGAGKEAEVARHIVGLVERAVRCYGGTLGCR
jgi:hypothetical protein